MDECRKGCVFIDRKDEIEGKRKREKIERDKERYS